MTVQTKRDFSDKSYMLCLRTIESVSHYYMAAKGIIIIIIIIIATTTTSTFTPIISVRGQILCWGSFHKHDCIHPHQQTYEKIPISQVWKLRLKHVKILVLSYQKTWDAGEHLHRWLVIPLSPYYESALWLQEIAPHCCVKWQWLVPWAFVFPLRVLALFSPCSLVSLQDRLLGSGGHIRLSALPHTCGSVPPSPAARLPDWLDSRNSLWLPFAYWNYQCDHRSNPISCFV